MSEPGPIQEYLRRLRTGLRGDPRLARRVVQEVADHLGEAARAEEARGLSPAEAERSAVDRFGPPEELVRHYARESAALRPLGALVALAAGGSLTVAAWLAWVLLFVLPRRDPGSVPMWTAVMLGFTGYAALTWWHVWYPYRARLRWVLALGSLAAVAAGTYVVLAMDERGRRGQGFEGYVVLMGLVLAGHGALMLLHLWLTARTRWKRAPG
ncbi:MAG TPA: permease prefix domain 1-containing protein [Candidatus Saccharimonadales bacterium]|nr:permease prefix domain 1-containing protein [Candidatus Saccharimonadales bacterium]